MTQIIGGRFRGKRLECLSNDTTRPTTNRVRENIFNILGERVRDSRVLDLFAGSGANTAECISRGATFVVANDKDPEAFNVLSRNTSSISCRGDSVVTTYNLDYLVLLGQLRGQRFDIVFLDPPYESDFGLRAIEYLRLNNMLSADSIVVFETEQQVDCIDGFDMRPRKYGRARIYLLQPQQKTTCE